MPQEFKQNHPDLFLPDKANDDLKEAFYKKNIKMHDLLNNSDNIDYLSKINPKVLLSKALKFSALDDVIYRFYKNDILDFIKKYGYCFEEAYYNYLIFDINQATKEEFENKMDEYIYYAITCGCKYNEIISDSIKTKHPELFLPKDIDKNIRDKFYDKNLTYEDLTANNNELLNKLLENNVDISYGFNKLKDIYNNYKWAPIDIRNKISLQLIELNYSIKDNAVSKIIFNYLKNNYDDLTKLKPDEINKLKEIVLLIINSNSAEVRNLKNSITKEVVNSENPKKTLEIIENVFIKNNLPTVGKTYTCFDLLHPNFNGFDINSKHSTISPVLKKCSPTKRSVVVFTDLIKSSFGSNNRSVNEYLNNLEKCNSMYENILSNKINIDSLTEEDIKELIKFTYHIETMYNNSQLGKDNKYHKDINKDNCIEVITDLKLLLSPNNSLDYKLSDRIIKMFCHFSGLDTVDEVKQYIKTKISQREEKSIELSKEGKIPLEKGDLVKGLNDIKYIGSILQNGSVAKEYLGAESTSDSTPLDTDVSMILSEGSTYQKLSATNANGYGPIWVVLKNDDRFITTRDSDGEKNVKDYKLGKLELFKTGVLGEDHYGIRTGFASSDIDCFICESDDDKLAVEIAMNGFYTPIADMTGKITFTYEDYKQMVEKMNGLSYYGKSEFIVDESVHKEDQIINKIVSELPDNKKLTEHKAELIKKKLEEVLEKQGIKLVDKINLEPKTAVLFNTGSTGRNTNLPGDGDFDYTMQIDNEIFINPDKLNRLREAIVDAFKPISGRFNDDIRDLETILTDENGKEFKLKIDITFTAKTDKVEYASDVCVVDRLNSIKDPKDREIVKANIIFAKKFLKSIEAYKAARADSSQGGMGGIGVENWILQNGGSFYKAAKTFVEAAEKSTNFTEFKKIYFLPNFGHNHMAYKKDFYPHDDYIKDNMNENGYEKMVGALKEYIRKYEADEKISLSEYEIDKKKTIGQNKYRDEESLLEDIKLLLSERNPNPVLTKANLGETGFMYLYEENGNKYLIKPGVNKKDIKTRPTRVEVQDIASKLQKIITPESCVDITVIGEGKLKIAMQPKFETVPCSDIIKEHANELLGEYIVDYLLGNFDSAMDNFIVDKDNILRGIDKEQGLKYTMMEEESAVSLKLDMSYKPRNSKGTIYPELFRRYVNGEIELDLNFLYSSVEKLKMISDVDYLKLYKGYINAYGPEKIDEKYNQILSRKKYLEKNLEKFLDGLVTEREIKAGFKM